jgi:hypothetical protein
VTTHPYRAPSPPPQEREVVPPAPAPEGFDLGALVGSLLVAFVVTVLSHKALVFLEVLTCSR